MHPCTLYIHIIISDNLGGVRLCWVDTSTHIQCRPQSDGNDNVCLERLLLQLSQLLWGRQVEPVCERVSVSECVRE